MSRPRKPYGPNPPGRLPATMIKVLAAEMSDQGRLSRGKRYWADECVVDIVIGHGVVTAEVQGSRPEPYVVTLEAEDGSGVPPKREVWIQCTCPDNSGFGSEACKHAVAALFALSDEVAIDPEVVARWRSSRRPPRDRSNVTELPPPAPPDDIGERERPADVISLWRRTESPAESGTDAESELVSEAEADEDAELDEIGRLLAAPGGAAPPELPVPEHLAHPPPANALLAEVLDDALDHLMIRWD